MTDNPFSLTRRDLLRRLFLTGSVAVTPAWLAACGGSGGAAGLGVGQDAAGSSQLSIPLGPLSQIPNLGELNADGAAIPQVAEGQTPFRIRVVARAGEQPAITNNPQATYIWHTFPDGGATYERNNGGWIYVSNSEVPGNGGVGALVFDQPPENDPSADAPIVDAYSILNGTSTNCAGGKTPWGTWLSCEEFDLSADDPLNTGLAPAGQVHECNPFSSPLDAQVKPALGQFSHEAAVVDLRNRTVYLTEDQGDGRFYRFVANTDDMFTDSNGNQRLRMASGTLQAMNIVSFGNGGYPEDDATVRFLLPVTWQDVVDPDMSQGGVRAGMDNAPGTRFDGGEGMWFYDLPTPLPTPAGGSVPTRSLVFFSTKGDNRVWAFDVDNQLIELIFDNSQIAPEFNDVDNVTVSPWGDILVAEDGPLQRIMVVIPNQGSRVLAMTDHEGSEITGPAFSPDGSRLYFSSQRGPGASGVSVPAGGEGSGNGVTFELFIPPQFRGNARA